MGPVAKIPSRCHVQMRVAPGRTFGKKKKEHHKQDKNKQHGTQAFSH